MAKVELKVRKLETGETLIAEFECFEDCETWLSDRPPFVDVLSCITDLPPERVEALKKSMRPFDDEENAFVAAAKAKSEAETERMYEEERRREEEEIEAYKRELKNADPNRPIPIRWDLGVGMHVADPYDDRAITKLAEDAVLEWVKERDGWVEKKGHVVDSANVNVYPGPLPDGKELRVVPGGEFTTAPKPAAKNLN